MGYCKGIEFQCPHGLELLLKDGVSIRFTAVFQCPHGLELLPRHASDQRQPERFNALMGLSCYCKNVQYFKFFMILFMHTYYL